jgi:putative resolvase
MAYIPLRKAVQFLGLHPNTLRKYADEGQIKSIKNGAGQRLYDVDSYQKDGSIRSVICYCRVSSAKQRDDLARQVEFMRQQYPDSEIIQDIGRNIKST